MPVKHLNVVDPLMSSNNLGRSVSRWEREAHTKRRCGSGRNV